MTYTQAKRRGTRFSVIVVDSQPFLEGQVSARKFADANIEVEYSLLPGKLSSSLPILNARMLQHFIVLCLNVAIRTPLTLA